MALWKAFKGSSENLKDVELHAGYVYFCTDDGGLFFDYADDTGNLFRKQVSADDCKTLTGVSLEELKNEIATQDVAILHEAQTYAMNQTIVALSEAQAYTDKAIESAVIGSVDLPITGSDGANTIVQTSDKENIAYGDNSIVFGLDSTAGCRGFYVKGVYINAAQTAGRIYLTDIQPTIGSDAVPIISDNYDVVHNACYDANFDTGYVFEDDMQFNLVLNENFNAGGTMKGTITEISGNMILFGGYLVDGDGNRVSGSYVPADRIFNEIDDFSFMIPTQPRVGACIVRYNGTVIGKEAKAVGISSVALGAETQASGKYAVATGRGSKAAGHCATAEGQFTNAYGMSSHAEGFQSETQGYCSHAEGSTTRALGYASHTEGQGCETWTPTGHAEGYQTKTEGAQSGTHAEGYQTTAIGQGAHSEGVSTTANKEGSHAGGYNSSTDHAWSFAHGSNLQTGKDCQAVFGQNNSIDSNALLVVGNGGESGKENLFTVGSDNTGNYITLGDQKVYEANFNKNYHIVTNESNRTFIANDFRNNTVSGLCSSAFGAFTHAAGHNAFAEGYGTAAEGESSHAEGSYTHAIGKFAHAAGYETYAEGESSHAEGNNTHAYGKFAHAAGYETYALGESSHAEGNDTSAYAPASVVFGSHNHAGAKGYYLNNAYWDTDYLYLALSLYYTNNCPISNEAGVMESSWGSSCSINLHITDYYPNFNLYVENYSNGLLTIRRNDYYNSEAQELISILQELDGAPAINSESLRSWSVVNPDALFMGVVSFGNNAFVSGEENKGWGNHIHIEGARNTAAGEAAHAEGADNSADGNNSHVEGQGNVSYGNDSHAEGRNTLAEGQASHAEGQRTIASGLGSHAGGCAEPGSKYYAEGVIEASGRGAFAHGFTGYGIQDISGESFHYDAGQIIASGVGAIALGYAGADNNTIASGDGAIAVGASKYYDTGSVASGYRSIALNGGLASGEESVAINRSLARGQNSFAMGRFCLTGLKGVSVVEATKLEGDTKWDLKLSPWVSDVAPGDRGHLDGHIDEPDFVILTSSPGDETITVNFDTRISDIVPGRHTCGFYRLPWIGDIPCAGQDAFATGYSTEALHNRSFTTGRCTQTSAANQTVVGQYNADNANALFIVGNGTADDQRSNAFEVITEDNVPALKLGNVTLTEAQLTKLVKFIDNMDIE